jgi:hypothetical protein
MKIENIKPFDGQHCETTATGTLLRQLDIELSEPMLFGLGQGLGFHILEYENNGLSFHWWTN